MFSAELVGPRPRLSGSCSLPKVPSPPMPRLPLPMRTAALMNCACRQVVSVLCMILDVWDGVIPQPLLHLH